MKPNKVRKTNFIAIIVPFSPSHLISSLLFSQLAALFELEEAAVEDEEKKLFYKFRIIDETNNERREREKLRGNKHLKFIISLIITIKKYDYY